MTVDVVGQALLAMEGGDWSRLKLLLHPYLRWIDSDGRTVRGRKNVLARLQQSAPAGPPVSHEIRDGQIYRWVE